MSKYVQISTYVSVYMVRYSSVVSETVWLLIFLPTIENGIFQINAYTTDNSTSLKFSKCNSRIFLYKQILKTSNKVVILP